MILHLRHILDIHNFIQKNDVIGTRLMNKSILYGTYCLLKYHGCICFIVCYVNLYDQLSDGRVQNMDYVTRFPCKTFINIIITFHLFYCKFLIDKQIVCVKIQAKEKILKYENMINFRQDAQFYLKQFEFFFNKFIEYNINNCMLQFNFLSFFDI